MRQTRQISPALQEMLARDEANGIAVFEPEPVVMLAAPAPPPVEFIIEPFDSSSFVEPVREVAPPPREDVETRPAKPAQSAPGAATRWQAGQVVADRGTAA